MKRNFKQQWQRALRSGWFATLTSALGVLVTCMVSKPAHAVVLAGETQPFFTPVGESDRADISSTPFFNGVAQLRINTQNGYVGCSGALLGTGWHILTAAQCLTDDVGNAIAHRVEATFSSHANFLVSDYFIHEDWQGHDRVFYGGDLAILKLGDRADETIRRYKINRYLETSFFTRTGYGQTGSGDKGAEGNAGKLRLGINTYDAIFGQEQLNLLGYDFDNGTPENDASGYLFGLKHLGLGKLESMAAPGDAGGPTFDFWGNIVGVTSFGVGKLPTDVDDKVNSSYGELGFDTRISFYSSWIDGVLNDKYRPTKPRKVSIPEPSLVAGLLLFGLGAFGTRKSHGKEPLQESDRW
ncbi:trypsin-like serine protease [Phormidium sp. CCY1219]|uniref:trypsin-like serine protease n=1 Tax=Phormidium sp. CCY1219 TaxID=2886104 RepID=UPI002D1F12BB|nr:trypsin-like serine protease [Phormidium sp. CCY1219]MEB3830835.1 trypsin-like serine protease [Phormidium sp. CCY1219]